MFTFQINADRCQWKHPNFLYNILLNASPLVFWCYTDLSESLLALIVDSFSHPQAKRPGMLEWAPAPPDLSGRSVKLPAGSIPSCSWSSLGFVFTPFSFVLAPCALIPGKGWKMHCKVQKLFAIHINNFNWIHFLTLQFVLPYNFMGFSSYQVFLSPISIITIISSKRSQIICFIPNS